MSQDLKVLYQQYSESDGVGTYEEFVQAKEQLGDEEFNALIVNTVKKKDQPIENGNPPSTQPMEVATPISSDLEMNQEQIQQLPDQSFLESDGTVQAPSTDLPSTDVVSSGTESSQINQPLSGITTPTLDNAGNIPMPTNPIQNPMVKNMGAQLNVNNRNLANIDAFYEANKTKFAQNGKRATLTFEGTNEDPIDVLGGKNNDIQGEITMTPSSPEELAADAEKRDQEAQAQIKSQEQQSSDFINQYADKDYIRTKLEEFNPEKPKWIDKNAIDLDTEIYVNQILEKERRGEVKVARNAEGQLIDKNLKPITDNSNILWQPQGEYINTYNASVRNFNYQVGEQNIDKARFNQGNIGNNPEQDAFGEFMSKASKFGVIPTTEEYEYLVTEELRNEYLANLEATQNAQKNKTTFQEEYDKVIGGYNLTDEVKFANGFDAVNSLNQGIENGNDKDKAEIDYFTKFFGDRNNVMDFGEYWEREGKAKYKSSLVRENQANYQQTRADIWNDYLSYKNDKLGVNQRFLEEAVVTSSAKADNYALAGNTVAMEHERAKMENLYSQYEANEAKMYEISEIFRESNKNFTSVAKKRKEQEDFQTKVEKGDFFDNAKNIAGQIPLAIGTSVNNLIGGGVRIANTILRSENLKDAADIIGETEIKVGNVKLDSRINQRIKYFKDQTTGVNYEERNGVLYGRNAKGELYKPSVQPDINNLKLEREETKLNGSGAVFGLTKLLSDIALTRGVGKSLNYSSKLLNNSKNIASVFGVESQFAKIASSYAKVANSQKAETIAYWFTQTFNENYLAAEAAGITSEKGKEIYATMMSGMIAGTSVISPDQNFLKVMNTNSRNIVASLLEGNIQKGALQASNLLKKLGVDVTNELKEEVPQQLLQDVGNIITNEIADTTFQTSTKEDYKDVVDGTIITVGAISLFGSGASLRNSNRAKINNEVIDLSIMPRSEVITKLAMDSRGLDYIRDYKESAIYPSLKNAAQKIEDEIATRKKYIDKIPDVEKYPTSALSEVTPILQELDRKREQLKKDDGTFAKTLNGEIENLTSQVNTILSGETVNENPATNNTTENAETAQSTPQSETVQEQTTVTENQPEQSPVQKTKPIAPIEPNGGAGSGVIESEQPTTTGEQDVPSQLNVSQELTKPTAEQKFDDLKNGKVSTFIYNNESEVPNELKDRISSVGEINGKKQVKVTLSTSEAEYLLSQQSINNNSTQPTENNLNLQDGQTTPEIQSTTAETQENVQPSNQAGQDTANQSNPATVENLQDIPADVTNETTQNEEDIVLPDTDWDALLGNLEIDDNEKVQTANIGTDGNPESGIDSVQQQGQAQAVDETPNSSGSESDAEVKQSPLSENQKRIADNVIVAKESFISPDGEESVRVTVTDNEGNAVEDKNGDYEFEFGTVAEADKFIDQKQKGYSLASNRKNTPKAEVTETTNNAYAGQRVSFTFLGEKQSGIIQEGNTILGDDGKKYPKGLAKNVTDVDGNKIDFQTTQADFIPIPQSTYDKLVKRLLGVFKKFGGKVITTKAEVDAKLKEFGVADYMIKAFHGSPHRFDRFSTEFMGSGEGQQAFGWGLYFTDLESIARNYANNLANLEIVNAPKDINDDLNKIFTKVNNPFKGKSDYITKEELESFLSKVSKYAEGEQYGRGEDKQLFDLVDNVWSYVQDNYDTIEIKANKNLYKVSLHKGKQPSEYTWLEWDKHISEKTKKSILDFISSDKKYSHPTWVEAKRKIKYALENDLDVTGEDLYKRISGISGLGQKESSLFLLDSGIDGVKYPAESISRGATSNNARGFNYVVFDENAVTIDEVVEFMKTPNGEIYGAKFPDGTIYLNPEKVNANTPIHEFSHLWQQLMPTRFKKGVELLKNTPIGKKTFAELKENKGYEGKTDDELWNEALVTVMGNEGERIFNQSKVSKFREWFVDFFKKLGEAFGIKEMSPNDKLSTFVKGALSEVMGTKEIIPESSVEQKEVPIYIKKMSNTDLRTMLDKLGLVMDAVCP